MPGLRTRQDGSNAWPRDSGFRRTCCGSLGSIQILNSPGLRRLGSNGSHPAGFRGWCPITCGHLHVIVLRIVVCLRLILIAPSPGLLAGIRHHAGDTARAFCPEGKIASSRVCIKEKSETKEHRNKSCYQDPLKNHIPLANL